MGSISMNILKLDFNTGLAEAFKNTYANQAICFSQVESCEFSFILRDESCY